MAVEANYTLKLEIDETLELGQDHVDDPEITHKIADDSGTLTATTTPAVTKAWSDKVTLAAGAGSIDLTALDRGSVLSDVDMTGLKIQSWKIKAPATNSAAITVQRDAGGSGYNLFGADKTGAEKILVSPGDVYAWAGNESREDVGAAEKLIDLVGTGTDVISFELVAG